jgi:hypothetical protein
MCFFFAAIDSNVVGFEVEGEEGIKDFEEDQGPLATQGKPSFDLSMLCYYLLLLSSCYYCLLIHLELVPLVLSMHAYLKYVDLLDTQLPFPFSGMMVRIMTFVVSFYLCHYACLS